MLAFKPWHCVANNQLCYYGCHNGIPWGITVSVTCSGCMAQEMWMTTADRMFIMASPTTFLSNLHSLGRWLIFYTMGATQHHPCLGEEILSFNISKEYIVGMLRIG